jgi:hypothetical protein
MRGARGAGHASRAAGGGGGGGVAARATLDLGALATGLGGQDPANGGHAGQGNGGGSMGVGGGGGIAARIRALFSGGGGGSGNGQDSERRGLVSIRSRKERKELRETRPEMREHAQVDGRRPSPVNPDIAHAGVGAVNGVDDPMNVNSKGSNKNSNDWASSRLSGRLRRGSGGAKPTAASSLGSLQSYAQNTVKDSGPLPGCFRTSTSEVELVRRFERRPGASGATGLESDFGNTVSTAGDDELVFSDEVRKNGLLSRRPDAFEYPQFALGEYGSPITW